jgi:hypothetical protein
MICPLATCTGLLGDTSSIVSNILMLFVQEIVAPLSAFHGCFLCLAVLPRSESLNAIDMLDFVESSARLAGLRFRMNKLSLEK